MDRWLVRRARTVPLILAPLLEACYPVTAHSTRVEHGLHLTMGMSAQVTFDSTASDGEKDAIRPSMAVGLAAGFSDSLRDGVSTRVALGFGPATQFADLYFEAPRSALGDWDAGIGATAQWIGANAVIPYVQAGREIGSDVAFFGSLGLALFNTDSLGKQRRTAATVALSVKGRRASPFSRAATSVVYLTVLPGARRLSAESSCFLVCANDLHMLGSTRFVLGITGELPIMRSSRPGPGPRLPPRR